MSELIDALNQLQKEKHIEKEVIMQDLMRYQKKSRR